MPIADDPITIEGLREFQRRLRDMDDKAPRKLRTVFNLAADIVVTDARPRVPSGPSGRARASLVARSTQREAIVQGGGRRAGYFPFLDFGGRVGRRRSVQRRFIPSGRYIYPSFARKRGAIVDALSEGLDELVTEAGLDVT